MTYLTRQPLMSTGLGLGIVSALVACFAGGRDVVSGPSRDREPPTDVSELSVGVIAVFLVAAVLLGVALAVPRSWVRIVGVAVLTAATATYAFIVITARTSDRFAVDADIALETGGVVLAGAFVLGSVGLVLTLVGARELDAAIPPDRLYPGTSGRATASLVLGLVGPFTLVATSLAVVFASMAFTEIRASGGVRTGWRLAVAGLVLGIVWLSIWGLFMALLLFTGSPTD